MVDPSAEKDHSFSAYIYAADNPIRFIDPDGRWFSDRNVKKADRFEKKIDKQIEMLSQRNDDGDLSARITELHQSKADIAWMRSDTKTEFRYVSAKKNNGNPSTDLKLDGTKQPIQTLFVEKNMGSTLHEGRHGGEIARGTLTGKTYGVQDEISAYKAQYAYDGILPYKPADFLKNNPNFGYVFQSLGSTAIPTDYSITNINLINVSLINNIGSESLYQGKPQWGPLYPPNSITRNQWINN